MLENLEKTVIASNYTVLGSKMLNKKIWRVVVRTGVIILASTTFLYFVNWLSW